MAGHSNTEGDSDEIDLAKDPTAMFKLSSKLVLTGKSVSLIDLGEQDSKHIFALQTEVYNLFATHLSASLPSSQSSLQCLTRE